MSITLIAGCVANNLMSVDAAEEHPEQIILPLTLIDYNADNLLFQYDMGDSIGNNFTFTTESFAEAVGATRVPLKEGDTNYYTQGLVSDTLNSATGTPQYKQEVVEQVARMVQAQLIKSTALTDTANFAALQSKLVVSDPAAIAMEEMTHENLTKKTVYFYDKGWQIQGSGYTQADGEIRNSNGVLIWEQQGDGIHYYGNGDEGDILVREVTGLDAAKEHSVKSWKSASASVSLEIYNGATLVDSAIDARTMTFSGQAEVTLKIVPTLGVAGNEEKIAAIHVDEITKVVSGGDVISTTEKRVYDNILNVEEIVKFENSGWKAVNAGVFTTNGNSLVDANGEKRWVFGGDGLEPWGTLEPVYKDVALRSGKQYIISYLGASAGKVNIYDADNPSELIASNIKSSESFTAPASGKIRIVYQPSGEEYMVYADDPQWWERNKLAKLALTEVNCILGTYTDSESKYQDVDKGFNDISTCMDYAYYMLNNMFISETDTNKAPYDGYKTITLSHAGNGVYEFIADISDWSTVDERYEVIYDAATKDIRNDRTKAYTGEGLFPLDGVSSDEGVYKSNISQRQHNYHYALVSHSYFYYDETKDLYFEFTGDDDVYLFINEKLALDLGGAHLAANKRINLNDMKAQLGLVHGKIYKFDFFYLERHTDFSNFYVNTNIQLLDSAKLSLNFYQEDILLQNGSTVEKNSEVELEYQLESYVNGLKDIQFSDKTLGIEIGVNGFKSTKGTKISEDGIRVTVYNEDGSVKEEKTFMPSQSADISTYFGGLTLELGEIVTVRGIISQMADKLDSEVSASFSSPRYAGATGDMVTNSSDAEGVIDVKEEPKTTEYKIQYFIEGETKPFKESEGTGTVGDEIKRDESVTLENYSFSHTNMTDDVLKLVEDKDQNVLKVYFVKDTTPPEIKPTPEPEPTPEPKPEPTTVKYKIQYFRDGETIPFVEKTGTGDVGDEITRDTSVTLAGYKYDRTNMTGDVLKLVADEESNVLKVYFVKQETSGDTPKDPPSTNLPSGDPEINRPDDSTTVTSPLTDDVLPLALSLVAVMIGLAGLCFRISRLGREEEWN